MFELSIKVSNEEKKTISKHLVYNMDVCVSQHDPILSALVGKAIRDFPGEIDDIKLTIHYFWSKEECKESQSE